ncbi:MAG: hypothetical protein WA056_01615 [Gallionella sp.]
MTDASSPKSKVLSSEFGPNGLSSHLIASFWPVQRKEYGSRYWDRIPDSPVVRAPLIESNLEMALSWNSPFENSSIDNVRPTISAMLRSGALTPHVGGDSGTGKFLEGVEGRTSITKLNSTQVFNGMPPAKIQVTALFRAWSNPKSEVEAPVNQLIRWALPEYLASDGPVLTSLEEIKKVFDGKSWSQAAGDAAFPSKAPTKIAMTYKGRLLSPLVIESISLPLDSPIYSDGSFTELVIPMTLCSLTAIDGEDWKHAIDPTFVFKGFRS